MRRLAADAPDALGRYREAIAGSVGAPARSVRLYWKGRVALYATLRALGVSDGDEVIVPGLTCVVVPNAVLYTGAAPVYADVRPDTLTVDAARVERLVGPRTRAIVVQNTFGLSADVDRLAALARRKGVPLIEDCTHGFGGSYDGRPNGALADFAFYSTQWNKPFSTGLGGILVSRRPDLDARLDALDRTLGRVPARDAWMLRLSLVARRRLLTDATYWPLVSLYRGLSARGLVVGSSAPAETAAPVLPEGYFRGFAEFQAREGLAALERLPAALAARRALGERLRALLAGAGKWHTVPARAADDAHLMVPVRCRDRAALFRRAEAARIRLSDWFVSPLHPVTDGLAAWGLDPRTVPVAATVASTLATIPADAPDPARVVAFVRDHLELLA